MQMCTDHESWSDAVLWRAVAPDGWCWAQWEEENGLFDAETGDTYILNELSALLLSCIAQLPRRTQWLYATTAEQCSVDADGSWRSRIWALLTSLEQLELIERRPATDHDGSSANDIASRAPAEV
jgi:PqqD family protein of HPr-rel-A system